MSSSTDVEEKKERRGVKCDRIEPGNEWDDPLSSHEAKRSLNETNIDSNG